jgi:hypothetical protein
MTTMQKNYKFIQDIEENLGSWIQKPTLFMVSIFVVIAIIFSGGLFFWASQFSYVFGRSSNQNQLQVARSGLQTMKRMVGDKQIWSESVKEEYNKIFSDQAIVTLPMNNSYDSNFIKSDYSTSQVFAK